MAGRYGVLRSPLGAALTWLAAAALTTGMLWWFRPVLDKAHMALAFLLVVLGGSALHGRRVGIGLAVLCFLCFNFFLLPPYYTFVVADRLDWVVLVTFLVTATVAAHLLDRAQREAEAAHERAEEINRLSTLGAETLNAARAEEAVQAIAAIIKTTLGVAECEIYHWKRDARDVLRIAYAGSPAAKAQRGSSESVFARVVESGAVMAGRADGTMRMAGEAGASLNEVLAANVDWHEILIPLKARGDVVGVLRLAHTGPLHLGRAQARFAGVLSYYAALGVERVRLVAEEERVEALRQADRVKDAVLASVSHDLRTPLTTIKAAAHELAATGDDRVLLIEEEADRLNRLVANLLDLSNLNAGEVPTTAEIVAAEDVIGAALQRVAGMQGEREIAVSIPPDKIPVGNFDFMHTLRILVNLLENALKYGPPDEPIDVRVCQDSNWLMFEVLDRGAGVPPHEADRIFQPFYRLPNAVPDVRGTGLGLAISRRLAEAQGGAVAYRPRRDGGSVFTLRLPAATLPKTCIDP